MNQVKARSPTVSFFVGDKEEIKKMKDKRY